MLQVYPIQSITNHLGVPHWSNICKLKDTLMSERDCCFGPDGDLNDALRALQLEGATEALPVFAALERAGLLAEEGRPQYQGQAVRCED